MEDVHKGRGSKAHVEYNKNIFNKGKGLSSTRTIRSAGLDSEAPVRITNIVSTWTKYSSNAKGSQGTGLRSTRPIRQAPFQYKDGAQ